MGAGQAEARQRLADAALFNEQPERAIDELHEVRRPTQRTAVLRSTTWPA